MLGVESYPLLLLTVNLEVMTTCPSLWPEVSLASADPDVRHTGLGPVVGFQAAQC